MKKLLKSLLAFVVMLAVVPVVSAQTASPRLEVQLKAFNITQNQDATKVGNHPGDVIRYTADVRNQGPGDLVDYEMRVYIRDILQYATIVDLGGGVIEGDYIKFPPILQAIGCDCSNANYFKVKLKDTVCAVKSLSARYESVTTTIPIVCGAPPAPPAVPTRTGPELSVIVLLALLFSGGAYVLVKRRA